MEPELWERETFDIKNSIFILKGDLLDPAMVDKILSLSVGKEAELGVAFFC